MSKIIIEDLTNTEELAEEALGAVHGGMGMGNWGMTFDFGMTSPSIGGYGIMPTGNPFLDAQLAGAVSGLNHAVMQTQGNPFQMYDTILGGVIDHRIATGQMWQGFYPGGMGLFF